MDLVVRHFRDLTTADLYEILRLRVAVFVVEQACAYQEIDGFDVDAWHVYFRDENGIQAYLRVLDRGTMFPDSVSIGRVVSRKRRCGLALGLLREGIRVAREQFAAKEIQLAAQVYARELYEKAGFRQTSEVYMEDGIPHINMHLLYC